MPDCRLSAVCGLGAQDVSVYGKGKAVHTDKIDRLRQGVAHTGMQMLSDQNVLDARS